MAFCCARDEDEYSNDRLQKECPTRFVAAQVNKRADRGAQQVEATGEGGDGCWSLTCPNQDAEPGYAVSHAQIDGDQNGDRPQEHMRLVR